MGLAFTRGPINLASMKKHTAPTKVAPQVQNSRPGCLKVKHLLMRLILGALALLSIITSKAQAADDSERALKIYFAGGTATVTAASEFRESIDAYKTQGGRDNPVGVLEIAGLYIKKADHLWLGALPSIVAEDYSSNYAQETSLALTRYNLDASAFWFLNAQKSVGVFYRADVGYSYLHRYERVNLVNFDRYYNGFNVKGELGYALRGFSDSTFWSFALGLFNVSAGAIQETGADITVGIML